MGDEWLVGEDIDVDIQQLIDFAKAIEKELNEHFKPSFENGVRPMLTVQAPFGAGGMKEGAFFRVRHDDSRVAVGKMLGDAMKGLVSLQMAAMSIASEYRTGDALAQADTDDIYNAFTAVDGQKTLDDLWRQGDDKKTSDPAKAIPPEVLDPEAYFAPEANNSQDPEATPEIDKSETIGEGTGAYTVQGDNEQMYGDQVARPDLRS
ncbi:hypothetical protein [Micromonospora sp. NPDC049204]|uniref:hypothetical protein n=1 Tax=unclassified Micromonospora TaxID=2617518 RepID=UPI0033F49FE5